LRRPAATRIHPITAGRFLAPLEEVWQSSLEFLVLRWSIPRVEKLLSTFGVEPNIVRIHGRFKLANSPSVLPVNIDNLVDRLLQLRIMLNVVSIESELIGIFINQS
jgi:hypothetical protein